jgi:hypothetical protein
MDTQELARRLDEARTFEHAVGTITYRLQVPARINQPRALASMREIVNAEPGAEGTSRRLVEVVGSMVVGIRGATSADVCIDGPVEALPDDAEAARLVLSERLEDAARLCEALSRRMVERNEQLQADRKN